MRVNVPRLITAYFAQRPEPAVPQQRVHFGTSEHRGSSFEIYLELAREFGEPVYDRVEAPATPEQKQMLAAPMQQP